MRILCDGEREVLVYPISVAKGAAALRALSHTHTVVLPRGVDEQDDLGCLRLRGQRHRRGLRLLCLRRRGRGRLGRRHLLVLLLVVLDRLMRLRGAGLVRRWGVGGGSSSSGSSRRSRRGGEVLLLRLRGLHGPGSVERRRLLLAGHCWCAACAFGYDNMRGQVASMCVHIFSFQAFPWAASLSLGLSLGSIHPKPLGNRTATTSPRRPQYPCPASHRCTNHDPTPSRIVPSIERFTWK